MQDGEIADLRVHVSFELQPKFKRDGKTERAITYIADFSYIDLATGERVIEDVKGGRATRTAQFEIKRKLMLYKYPDIDFRVIEM